MTKARSQNTSVVRDRRENVRPAFVQSVHCDGLIEEVFSEKMVVLSELLRRNHLREVSEGRRRLDCLVQEPSHSFRAGTALDSYLPIDRVYASPVQEGEARSMLPRTSPGQPQAAL